MFQVGSNREDVEIVVRRYMFTSNIFIIIKNNVIESLSPGFKL